MKILNTIVFYDNCEEVEKYILEVASIANGMVDVVLVVNSDKCNLVENMAARLSAKGVNSLQVRNYGENVGYLNTMLKTIKQIDLAPYDFVILSNTDIRYDTKDFFQRLALNRYETDVGCIAPCVYATQSNSYSNPHYYERVSKTKLKRLVRIFKHPLMGKVYLKLAELKAGNGRKNKKESCYVYSPHGCYMIFTKDFINCICGYEYGVKMYSEESAIGELLKKYGKKCFYDSSISVVHQESTVTGRINYKKRFFAWRESLEYILREFYENC